MINISNTDICNIWKLLTVNPEFSSQKFFLFDFISIWDDVHETYNGDNHFLMYVSQIIIFYTLNLYSCWATAAKSLQSCPTLCDPIDSSPLGSSVPEILQARTLEWVAISFSNAWKWKVKGKSLSCARLLATPWTAAYQAPPSMGFSRQEYWSGVPLPSPIQYCMSITSKYNWMKTKIS